MSSFKMYQDEEPPSISKYDWNPFGPDLEMELGRRWLARLGGFDYGAMTVWLMRGFGPPNMPVYDSFKHSFSWGLETQEGYVIRIEPGLIRINPEDYAAAPETREGNNRSKKDFHQMMAAHRVISAQPLRADVSPLNDSMIDGWLDQFARPVYVRDVGGTVLGPISQTDWAKDVGPGHNSVLDGGHDYPVFVAREGRKHPSC